MNPQIKQAKLETLEAIIKEVEGMLGYANAEPYKSPSKDYTKGYKKGYKASVEIILQTLQADLTLLKNER